MLHTINCSVCYHSISQDVLVEHAVFRHEDFMQIAPHKEMYTCSNCYLSMNSSDNEYLHNLKNHFESESYADSKQTDQTFNLPEYKEAVTRSFIQGGILYDHIKLEHPKILDIGCFDGRLLYELFKLFPKAILHGYDVNPNLQTHFPQEDNFSFFSGQNIDSLTGAYDLICLSHSLMYIKVYDSEKNTT